MSGSGRQWPQVSAVIADLTGLYFPPERSCDLQRGLREAARELGLGSAEECAQRMLAAPPTRAQLQALVRQLTVGETYFFRDRRTFQTLSQVVLPELVR